MFQSSAYADHHEPSLFAGLDIGLWNPLPEISSLNFAVLENGYHHFLLPDLYIFSQDPSLSIDNCHLLLVLKTFNFPPPR